MKRFLTVALALALAASAQAWPFGPIREFMTQRKAGTLGDENSRAVAEEWLQNAQDHLDLWKKYHQQISEAVSPIRAAQFLQVENQMAIFVDLNIPSEMPVIGDARK